MYSVLDENVIKLHTHSDGRIWYSSGLGPATNSEQLLDSFLLSPVLNGLGVQVRILGLPQNAELISAMYLRRYKNEIRVVEVAGPNVLHTPDDINDPQIVLRRMRSVDIASAAGGWHAVSVHDYPTYAMLARMLRTNFVFDDAAQAYLKMHPAYKALLFIPTLSDEVAAQLLTTIVDPRWYVDRRAPDRAAKLELYLGLTPQVQARVSSPKLLTRGRELRCATVLRAWKTVPPEAVDLTLPANFLYRIHKAAGGDAKGDLRASQAFVRYLRYNWLAGLESRKGTKDGLFAPNLFFKTPAERAAYAEHMSKKAQP
ncbi:hypothetical protein EBZ80_15230 [bacterium]|nr:hypothetical protein [Betaproteobacteria bacterium]NDE16277.1 hypothetical protein [bacterium]